MAKKAKTVEEILDDEEELLDDSPVEIEDEVDDDGEKIWNNWKARITDFSRRFTRCDFTSRFNWWWSPIFNWFFQVKRNWSRFWGRRREFR